ncbi:MAG: DUF4445 domain-containing protein, partial [Dehalococcoidia bacterium]
MSKHLVVFEPSGRRGYIAANSTILEAARVLGEDIESTCGGKMVCGKCIINLDKDLFARHGIELVSRSFSPPSSKELKVLSVHGLAEGSRLACQTKILGDIVVFVPAASRRAKYIVHKAGINRIVKLKPAIRKYHVEVPPAGPLHPHSDTNRLTAKLKADFNLSNLKVDVDVLYSLPGILKETGGEVTATVWMGKHIVCVQPGYAAMAFGAAIDIGTTTVAAYLCDLTNGEVIETAADLNPQIAFGADVITRISYALMQPDGLNKLNYKIISCIGNLLSTLMRKAMILPSDISEITVVGNTTMHHLFLNLDPAGLGKAPFTPVVNSSLDLKAGELGLGLGKMVNVHTLPVIAGFVGADTVGVLISEGPHKQNKNMLIIDIGTNGELVLGNRKKLMCTSCAMGPAFEGGNIKFGMRAAPGAIEKVEIDPRTLSVKFKVVDSNKWNTQQDALKATGICGSGIIDAVGQMVRAGIVKSNGGFNKSIHSDRLINTGEGPAFVIAHAGETDDSREITIGIDDIRSV